MDWKEIEDVISEASESGDPILSRVRDLRLDINHFSILLWDPYAQVIYSLVIKKFYVVELKMWNSKLTVLKKWTSW